MGLDKNREKIDAGVFQHFLFWQREENEEKEVVSTSRTKTYEQTYLQNFRSPSLSQKYYLVQLEITQRW